MQKTFYFLGNDTGLAQREHDYFAETVICANCCFSKKAFAVL